jgi:hypothetical protein
MPSSPDTVTTFGKSIAEQLEVVRQVQDQQPIAGQTAATASAEVSR